jgi:acetyl-CoA carboxylase biotin carboxyl carrier protein
MPDPTTANISDLNDAAWHQIAGWLADTDIELAEISGAGWQVRLLRETGYQPEPAHESGDEPLQANRLTEAPSGQVIVKATVVGVFLDHHPLRGAPLAPIGAHVRRGDVIGLLRLGIVLAPVMAPVDGVVAGHLVPSGTLAGFGTALVHIHAGEASWK